MLTSDKLVAQVTPYNESPATAIFNTTGLKNAIKPLRETCNW
ncbi:type VI secretion protein [Pseudoalteromonas sp. MIP2626]|nr:type VI secretion protein [Pseudoalteromonas sp. MIP2626]